MRLYTDLKDVTFSSGANSGGDLKLSQVPATVNGRENYINELIFRLTGTITAAGGGSVTLSAGEITALFQRILLEVPGLRPLLNNVRGLDLHRIYSLRNKGDVPAGTGAVSVSAGATQAVDFSVVVQFADPGARKYSDGSIPARLLKDANLLCNFEVLSNVHANLASASLTLKTTAVSQPRAEVVIPSMATIEAHDFASGEVQPTIPKSSGKVSHLMVAKQRTAGGANTGFASTDFVQSGLRYGAVQVSQDSLATSAFYAAFAEYANVDYTDHVSGTGKISEGIPLEFPPLGMDGQHTSYELADARTDWRLKTNAVGTAYSIIRREVWVPGPWLDTVRDRLNISRTAKFKAKTASHKGLPASAAEGLPLKQVK